MPSSHSATVCGLAAAAAIREGFTSSVFALSLVLATVVMYDAMGVRRETGEQAKVLNRILNQWMDDNARNAPIFADKKLKEMVGHTPFEVLSGAVLGVLIGFVLPVNL